MFRGSGRRQDTIAKISRRSFLSQMVDAGGRDKMTEDEAKKKWCPMIRDCGTYQGMIYSGVNSSEGNPAGYNCIASDCMMWRWREWVDDLPIEGNCGLGGI
jgi:hypothetical protein